MANEGIEVIHANNRRVAAAKKTVDLTARSLQAAKLAVEAAQKNYNVATKELKDAEKSQKAAQEKWEVVDLVEDDEQKPKSNYGSKKRVGVSSISEVNNASKKARSDSNIPKEVLVEGCGVAGVNGIYKRDGEYNGSPQYIKEGEYKGDDVMFKVQRHSLKLWLIRIERKKRGDIFCYSNWNETFVPPINGWCIRSYGVEPPPKITLNP